jgi:hypothetical protein
LQAQKIKEPSSTKIRPVLIEKGKEPYGADIYQLEPETSIAPEVHKFFTKLLKVQPKRIARKRTYEKKVKDLAKQFNIKIRKPARMSWEDYYKELRERYSK